MLTAGTNGVLIQQNDVLRLTQPLVAGNNVLTHNLGFAPVAVQLFNNATGALITFTVVSETPTTTTIFLAVGVNMARINFDC